MIVAESEPSLSQRHIAHLPVVDAHSPTVMKVSNCDEKLSREESSKQLSCEVSPSYHIIASNKPTASKPIKKRQRHFKQDKKGRPKSSVADKIKNSKKQIAAIRSKIEKVEDIYELRKLRNKISVYKGRIKSLKQQSESSASS